VSALMLTRTKGHTMTRFTSLVLVLASVLATSLASANTITVQSPDPAFGQCRVQELEQAGRKGETVLVCETVKVKAPKVRKPGRTTVEHIGRGK
jgi:hypothetical protein